MASWNHCGGSSLIPTYILNNIPYVRMATLDVGDKLAVTGSAYFYSSNTLTPMTRNTLTQDTITQPCELLVRTWDKVAGYIIKA